MQPDILITAPLPPFLYEPLKSSYRCHDYYKAEDKPGTLEAVGKRIRGLVQGGGTVTPTSLLDALAALEIISVFGVGYDGVPVAYCKARGIKVTNTPAADSCVSIVSSMPANGRSAHRTWPPSSRDRKSASSDWAASARRSPRVR